MNDNPWGQLLQSDSSMVQSGMEQSQNNMQSLQNQFAGYQGQQSPYPTFPNSMGLGSQDAFQGEAQPGYAPAPVNNQPLPDSGSRGFNPWSLRGESNVREG